MTASRAPQRTSGLGQYLAIFRKRLWMILLLFAVTMTVILAQALTAKPVYQAAVRLQVIPMESEQVALYGQAPPGSDVDLTAFVFREAVRSGTVAWRTIGQLGLGIDAEGLLRDIAATQENEFVTVTARADSPQTAEAIVTAHVDNALASYRQDRDRPTTVTGEFVETQLTDAKQALSAAQTALQQFKLDHGFDSLERETNAAQDVIRSLRQEQEVAALSVAQLRAHIRALEAEAKASEATARAAKEGSDEKAVALRRASEQFSAIAALRGELAGQEARQAGYDDMIERWEADLISLIGLTQEYTRLSSAVTQAQNTHDFLFGKALEARLKQKQAEEIGYLRVVEPARRPDQPIPSRTLQIALVGGLLSLVAGAVLALLFELIESAARRANA